MATTESTAVIDRAFAVLQACAESRRTVSLADLVRLTGLPKTTLHRLCWKLEELGALEHHTDGFRIGPRLFALGAINPTVQRLRTQTMPFLYGMSEETGLVANLAVMQDERVLLVDEVFADERPVPRMVGALMPLHATALGKALLAAEPPARRKALLGSGPLKPYTRHTIIRTDRLLEQIAIAAQTGIAYSREEWRLGFAGVASPIVSNDRASGAVALVGIKRAADVTRYADSVLRAAKGAAAALNNPIIRDSRGAYWEESVAGFEDPVPLSGTGDSHSS
jgi:IclR family transcriptional regulator, acetate operon repressor